MLCSLLSDRLEGAGPVSLATPTPDEKLAAASSFLPGLVGGVSLDSDPGRGGGASSRSLRVSKISV